MDLSPRSEEALRGVHPDLVVRARQIISDFYDLNKILMVVTEGFRSPLTQLEYFAKGRRRLSNGTWAVVDKRLIVTHALPGTSFHSYGLAFDVCFPGKDPYLKQVPKDDSDHLWAQYGYFVEKLGLTWGGQFSKDRIDRPHAEMTYGLSLNDLMELNQQGGIYTVWTKIDSIIACGQALNKPIEEKKT